MRRMVAATPILQWRINDRCCDGVVGGLRSCRDLLMGHFIFILIGEKWGRSMFSFSNWAIARIKWSNGLFPSVWVTTESGRFKLMGFLSVRCVPPMPVISEICVVSARLGEWVSPLYIWNLKLFLSCLIPAVVRRFVCATHPGFQDSRSCGTHVCFVRVFNNRVFNNSCSS